MNKRRVILCSVTLVAIAVIAGGLARAQPDDQRIRLGDRGSATQGADPASAGVELGAPKSGFDHASFEARLESLWFARKALLRSGRHDDATEQLEEIRAFCAEEGVKRLEHFSGALIAEVVEDYEEGRYARALDTLRYAEAFDPDRPQTHLLRAAVHRAEGAWFSAAGQLFAALRAGVARSIRELALFHQIALLVSLAVILTTIVFCAVMLLRYHVPFRHEIEESLRTRLDRRSAAAVGWGVLALPLVTWFGAGWAVAYGLAVSFRFMKRSERLATCLMLALCTLTLPAYRVSVALYGTAADPSVRTTLLSAGGEYDPDRIVRLRQLVNAYPEEPVYRFLLAGLYKNGRYFEEAFAEYKQALEISPDLSEAYLNIGNVFYATGQHGEAIANYRKVLELDPGTFLAFFNMHLAQSESFRFSAAEDSLQKAREIDSSRVATLLTGANGWDDRPAVQDAELRLPSIWDAAVTGRTPLALVDEGEAQHAGIWQGAALSPFSLVPLFALALGLLLAAAKRRRDPARRCIRCGRAFCFQCKSSPDAKEYCTQCLHLFVLGDGLAPGTKSRKLYDVECHERRTRRLRGLSSLVLPGTAHLLRGKTVLGILLVMAWSAALIAIRPGALGVVGRGLGLELRPELLTGSGAVPLPFSADPLGLTAIVALPLLWIAGNAWRWRRRESQR